MDNKENNSSKQEAQTRLSSRGLLVVVMALALVCVAIVIFLKYPPKPAAQKPSLVQAGGPHLAQTPAEQLPKESSPDAAQPPASPVQPASDKGGVSVKGQDPAQTKKDAKPQSDKVVQDPLSRVALSLVGVDSDAEDYWLGAVFDPNLPTSERQDLIDDLNEEGLPDPKHPTEDDLPVLYSRLEMLEALVPFVHGSLEWEEAREDLLNLIANAMGGGYPVD